MSDNVIDALRVHSMGVKKPFGDKDASMAALAAQGNRYYPLTGNGNVDEWGAVIKRQTEVFQRELQDKAVDRQNQARAYGDELSQAIKQKKQQTDLERFQKIGERDNMLRAVAEADNFDQMHFDRQRQ